MHAIIRSTVVCYDVKRCDRLVVFLRLFLVPLLVLEFSFNLNQLFGNFKFQSIDERSDHKLRVYGSEGHVA